jgi:REP element-mobilizing transposase RayT
MSQSLSQVYVHLIFSTKERVPCLTSAVQPHLHAYMAQVLNNLGCPALRVGGTRDHIHALFTLHKNLSAADLVEAVKIPTSRWLKTQGPSLKRFHWQSGYSAFSVSHSQVGRVRTYIDGQKGHHAEEGYQDEFRRFLERYRVEYDERYVWD